MCTQTSPWHYVDVPITESRYASKYCQPEGCVVSKIHDFKRVLKNPQATKDQRQDALKFLIHFIEDLHQPLHVGDTDSKGGNLVQVRFFERGSNLHQVWGSQIIEHYSGNEQDWLGDLKVVAIPSKVAERSKGTPEDWATESLQAAKEAYCLPGTQNVIKSGTSLGGDYCRMALPLIQQRLAKAGVRVA